MKIIAQIRTLALCLLVVVTASSFMSNNFRLEGIWLTEGGKPKVKIYSTKSGEYQGKLIWTKDNSALAKKTIGSIIIDKMKPVDTKKFEGYIYDPTKNSKYNSKISVVNDNTINLRGYLGISLLGRTEKWTRVE